MNLGKTRQTDNLYTNLNDGVFSSNRRFFDGALYFLMEYTIFGERLHKLGFNEDASESAPICRWQHGQIKLDLMPLGKDSWLFKPLV